MQAEVAHLMLTLTSGSAALDQTQKDEKEFMAAKKPQINLAKSSATKKSASGQSKAPSQPKTQTLQLAQQSSSSDF